MQGIFQKENTDKALKYGIYRHLPTYEKIIRNLVSFYPKNTIYVGIWQGTAPKSMLFTLGNGMGVLAKLIDLLL